MMVHTFRDFLKKEAVRLFTLIGCIAAVQALWVALELHFYGTTVQSPEDTIIGILFSWLLWHDVCRWMEEDKK